MLTPTNAAPNGAALDADADTDADADAPTVAAAFKQTSTVAGDPRDGIQLMDLTGFTWQYCSEHEEWDSPGRPPTRRPSGTSSTPTHCGGPPSPGAATRWTRLRPGSAASWSFPPEDREIFG